MTDKETNKNSEQTKKNADENNQENTNKDHGFWDDTKDNISEGARLIGEEARNLGSKVSSYSEVLFGKIREKTSDALKYGLDLTEEGVSKAQELGEQLRDNIQINKLNNEKKRVATQLGMKFYLAIKENKNKVPKNLLENEEILSLLKDLEDIDKEILKLSEQH